jgi:hypothetical protein
LHVILQPSSSIVLGALLVLFAFVVSNHLGNALGLGGTVVVLALTVMLSMKLIGFLMLTVRHEAISQVLGLLILENGIFLGSQILVPGMPMLIELVLLFDLLVIVVSFGVLVRYLVAHVGSTSRQQFAWRAGAHTSLSTRTSPRRLSAWLRRFRSSAPSRMDIAFCATTSWSMRWLPGRLFAQRSCIASLRSMRLAICGC